MAKIVVTFEDVEDAVSVKIESELDLGNLSKEEQDNLTEAQQMGLRMTHILQKEYESMHEDDHDCGDPACKCPHLSGQSMSSVNPNYVAPQELSDLKVDFTDLNKP